MKLIGKYSDLILAFFIIASLTLFAWNFFGMDTELIINPSNLDWEAEIVDGNGNPISGKMVELTETNDYWNLDYHISPDSVNQQIKLSLKYIAHSYFDLTKFYGAKINIEAKGDESWYCFQIRSFAQDITIKGSPNSYRIHSIEYQPDTLDENEMIFLSDLSVPEEWAFENRISLDSYRAKLNKVKRIEFATPDNFTGGTGLIRLYGISLKGKIISLEHLSFFILIFWSLIALIFLFTKLKSYRRINIFKNKKDKLTNIYYYESVKSHLNRLSFLITENFHCSVLVINVDYMEYINNDQGRDVGDKILLDIVNVLKSHSRKGDIISRWHNDEFVVMYQGCEYEYALEVANEICKESCDLGNNITISIGVATMEGENSSFYQALQLAQISLRKAKDEGRNRVIGYR